MKRLLITGGSGFLGKNLALKLKSEYDVFLCARNNGNNLNVSYETGCPFLPMDIFHIESVRDVIREVRPQIIVHSAAMKFMDLAEKFPLEAVDINVVGSQNIARVAMEYETEFVLGISTDKASPPVSNTYGLTKSLMEKMFCLNNNKCKTKFSCVRFGNLAWSTGSVFPIWKRMYDNNEIIKSKGREMMKFFLKVDAASGIIKTIISNQNLVEGKIVAKSMKSVKMKDIIDVWMKKFGGRWEFENERPGERLHEYLVGESETEYTELCVINGDDYFLIHPNNKAKYPIKTSYSTFNASKFTADEILELITCYELF